MQEELAQSSMGAQIDEVLALLNRLSETLCGKFDGGEEERFLPFACVERRPDGLYYAVDEDEPFTGAMRRWRSVEELSDHVGIRYGALHGPSICWYPAGSLLGHHGHDPRKRQRKYEIHYVGGLKHGLETRYFPDGRPVKYVEFQGGRMHGLHVTWWHNGHKRREAEYEEGEVRDGV